MNYNTKAIEPTSTVHAVDIIKDRQEIAEFFANPIVTECIRILKDFFGYTSKMADITSIQPLLDIVQVMHAIITEMIDMCITEDFITNLSTVMEDVRKLVHIQNFDINFLRKNDINNCTTQQFSADDIKNVAQFCTKEYERTLYDQCYKGDFSHTIPHDFMNNVGIVHFLQKKLPSFIENKKLMIESLEKIRTLQKEITTENVKKNTYSICKVFVDFMYNSYEESDINKYILHTQCSFIIQLFLLLRHLPSHQHEELVHKIYNKQYFSFFLKNYLHIHNVGEKNIISPELTYSKHLYDRNKRILTNRLTCTKNKGERNSIRKKIESITEKFEKLFSSFVTPQKQVEKILYLHRDTILHEVDAPTYLKIYTIVHEKNIFCFFQFINYICKIENKYSEEEKRELHLLYEEYYKKLPLQEKISDGYTVISDRNKKKEDAQESLCRVKQEIEDTLDNLYSNEDLEKIDNLEKRKKAKEEKEKLQKKIERIQYKEKEIFDAINQNMQSHINLLYCNYRFYTAMCTTYLDICISRCSLLIYKYVKIKIQIKKYVSDPFCGEIFTEIAKKEEEAEKKVSQKTSKEKKWPQVSSDTGPAIPRVIPTEAVREKGIKQQALLRTARQQQHSADCIVKDLRKVMLTEQYATYDQKIQELEKVSLTIEHVKSVLQKCGLTIGENTLVQLTSLHQEVTSLLKKGYKKDWTLVQSLESEIQELSSILADVTLAVEHFSQQRGSERTVSVALKKIEEKKRQQCLKACYTEKERMNQVLITIDTLLHRWQESTNILLKVTLKDTVSKIEEIILEMEKTLNSNDALKKEVVAEYQNCHRLHGHLKEAANIVEIDFEILQHNLQTEVLRFLADETILFFCAQAIERCREKWYTCHTVRQACFEQKTSLSDYITILDSTLDHCLAIQKDMQKEYGPFICAGSAYAKWLDRKKAYFLTVENLTEQEAELKRDTTILTQEILSLTTAHQTWVKSAPIKKAKKALGSTELKNILTVLNVALIAREKTDLSTQLAPYLTQRHELFILCVSQHQRLQQREDLLQKAHTVASTNPAPSFSDVAGLFVIRDRIRDSLQETRACLDALQAITALDQTIAHQDGLIEEKQQELTQQVLRAMRRTAVTAEKPSHTITEEKFIEMMVSIRSTQSLPSLQALLKENQVKYTLSRDLLSQTAAACYTLYVHDHNKEVHIIRDTHCCFDGDALNRVSTAEILLQAECAALSAQSQGPPQSMWVGVNDTPILTTTACIDQRGYCLAQHVGCATERALCAKQIECAHFSSDAVALMKGQFSVKNHAPFTGTHAKSIFMKKYQDFEHCITTHVTQHHSNGLSLFCFTVNHPSNPPRCIIKTVYDEKHPSFIKKSLSQILCAGARRLYVLAQQHAQESPIAEILYEHTVAPGASFHFTANFDEKKGCPTIQHVFPVYTSKARPCKISYRDGTYKYLDGSQ